MGYDSIGTRGREMTSRTEKETAGANGSGRAASLASASDRSEAMGEQNEWGIWARSLCGSQAWTRGRDGNILRFATEQEARDEAHELNSGLSAFTTVSYSAKEARS